MKLISTIIKAVVVAYLVIFAVVNVNPVEIRLFFNSTPFVMPMFLFTLLCIFFGFVAGALMMLNDHFSLGRQIKKMKKEMGVSENEISRLKTLTITDTDKAKTTELADTDTKQDSTGTNKDTSSVLR